MNQVVTANVGRETPLAFELDFFFFFFTFRLDLEHQFFLGLELAGLWTDTTPSALLLGLLTQSEVTLLAILVLQLVSCRFGDFSAFIIR